MTTRRGEGRETTSRPAAAKVGNGADVQLLGDRRGGRRRVRLERPGAVVAGVMHRGRGEGPAHPAAAVAGAHEQAGDRPDALVVPVLGATLPGDPVHPQQPGVRRSRLDGAPADGASPAYATRPLVILAVLESTSAAAGLAAQPVGPVLGGHRAERLAACQLVPLAPAPLTGAARAEHRPQVVPRRVVCGDDPERARRARHGWTEDRHRPARDRDRDPAEAAQVVVFTTGSAPPACTGDSASVPRPVRAPSAATASGEALKTTSAPGQRRVDVRRRPCRRSASRSRRCAQSAVPETGNVTFCSIRSADPSRNSGVENRSRSRSCACAVACCDLGRGRLQRRVGQQRLLVRPLASLSGARRQAVAEAVVRTGPVQGVEPVAGVVASCGPATCSAAGRCRRARTTASATSAVVDSATVFIRIRSAIVVACRQLVGQRVEQRLVVVRVDVGDHLVRLVGVPGRLAVVVDLVAARRPHRLRAAEGERPQVAGQPELREVGGVRQPAACSAGVPLTGVAVRVGDQPGAEALDAAGPRRTARRRGRRRAAGRRRCRSRCRRAGPGWPGRTSALSATSPKFQPSP